MTATSSEEPSTLDRGRIRVAIVDDHALISETLALVLSDKGFHAVGVRPTHFDEVLAFITDNRANVALLDLNLGELGLSVPIIPQIRELGCEVIVLTGDTSRPQWGACIEAGAVSVVSKAVSFMELLEQVMLLLDDVVEKSNVERYELLESLRMHREEERERLAPFAHLTAREHEVLAALTRGLSADDIAATMYVSLATVRTHIRSILTKLGVNSQLAAVALARQAGWNPQA